MMWKW